MKMGDDERMQADPSLPTPEQRIVVRPGFASVSTTSSSSFSLSKELPVPTALPAKPLEAKHPQVKDSQRLKTTNEPEPQLQQLLVLSVY